MGHQQPHRRQRHRPLRQPLQNHRESAGRPGHFDPSIGRVLGQMQDLCAIDEQRGAALAEVESPFVQFRQVGDEECRRLALASGEVPDTRQQRVVGELGHCGESRLVSMAQVYHGVFRGLRRAQAARELRDPSRMARGYSDAQRE